MTNMSGSIVEMLLFKMTTISGSIVEMLQNLPFECYFPTQWRLEVQLLEKLREWILKLTFYHIDFSPLWKLVRFRQGMGKNYAARKQGL